MVAISPAFEIEYSGFGFRPGTLSTRSPLAVRTRDLAHALFTTGREPGDQRSHGAASTWEWLHRASLIPAYLQRLPGGGLVRSALAVELDRSEKVGLSYALGQALTAIFCERVLGVSHLLHVDRYKRRFDVRFTGRRRADLFGLAPLGWVVAEAKGRSGRPESALARALREQKRAVADISGAPPWVSLGCVAWFQRDKKGRLRVDAYDPEEPSPEPVSYDIDPDRYLLAYYEPFLNAIAQAGAHRDDGYLVGEFGGLGLRIGLRDELAERVTAAQNGSLAGLAADLREASSPQNVRSAGMTDDRARTREFPDGTFVETDWDDALTAPFDLV